MFHQHFSFFRRIITDRQPPARNFVILYSLIVAVQTVPPCLPCDGDNAILRNTTLPPRQTAFYVAGPLGWRGGGGLARYGDELVVFVEQTDVRFAVRGSLVGRRRGDQRGQKRRSRVGINVRQVSADVLARGHRV